MPDPDRTNDAFAAFVVERLARRVQGNACPDANRIAGFVERRLAPDEQRDVEAHLGGCGSCRSFVAAEGVIVESQETAPVRPGSRRFLLAAASLFVVAASAVLVVVLSWGPAATTEESLVAAARVLASERPDLFSGFEPLARAERTARGRTLEQGTSMLLHPVEKILDVRPTFRWEPIAGAAEYEVALLTADGRQLWRAQTHHSVLAFPAAEPALVPGKRYLWLLEDRQRPVRGAHARDAKVRLSPWSRVFEVATAAEQARFDEAARVIDARLPSSLAPLLKSHFALRMGLVEEAEKAIREYLASAPEDEIAREMVFRALTVKRVTGADRLEIPLLPQGK